MGESTVTAAYAVFMDFDARTKTVKRGLNNPAIEYILTLCNVIGTGKTSII
jgi:hypothetical protein